MGDARDNPRTGTPGWRESDTSVRRADALVLCSCGEAFAKTHGARKCWCNLSRLKVGPVKPSLEQLGPVSLMGGPPGVLPVSSAGHR